METKKPRKSRGSLEKRGNSEFWQYRFTVEGREHRRSTGTKNKEEAELIMKAALALAEGKRQHLMVTDTKNAIISALARDSRPSTIGAAAEKLVCADLMNKGYAVFEAASPNSPCDLVAGFGDCFLRIEVKVGSVTDSGSLDHNRIRPTCAYDVLAVATRSHGIIYVPPLEEMNPGGCTKPTTADQEAGHSVRPGSLYAV